MAGQQKVISLLLLLAQEPHFGTMGMKELCVRNIVDRTSRALDLWSSAVLPYPHVLITLNVRLKERKTLARKRKKKKRKCLHYKVPTCYPISGIVYRWAQGLSGVPDVPHAANVSFVTEGSGVGVSSEPPVSAKSLFRVDDNNISKVVSLNALANTNVAMNLCFYISLVDKLHVVWETILQKGTLYVEVPNGILPEGSKESLVTLLEYAEEKLRCNHVVLCFRKDRSDRASLVKTFMFMGFAVAPPGDSLLPHSPDLMCLVYRIEPDDEED